MEWKKICCTIDFSEGARLALRHAAELARRLGAELTLLHVLELPAILVSFAEAEQAMGRWRAEAEQLANRSVAATVLRGGGAAEIVAFAREHGFDLLVLGSSGGSGLKRLLLGSVVERVARQAPCPVLIVRPREQGGLEVTKEELEQYQKV